MVLLMIGVAEMRKGEALIVKGIEVIDVPFSRMGLVLLVYAELFNILTAAF